MRHVVKMITHHLYSIPRQCRQLLNRVHHPHFLFTMAKSKKPKADKADKPKVDKTFDKRRKKARKEDMRWQKKMLRRMLCCLKTNLEREH